MSSPNHPTEEQHMEVVGSAFIVLILLGLLSANVWAFVACWQKGRKAYFWASFAGIIVPFIGILHWVGAIRLGRPESGWAQRRYGPEKMARARERFGLNLPNA